MAQETKIYDGQLLFLAQDASTHPSYLPDGYVSIAINRQFRGGLNRTRPRFVGIDIISDNAEILSYIETSNFQGAMYHRATIAGTYDGLIAAFGGKVVFFLIVNDIAIVYDLGVTLDSQMMHIFFCQAEDQIFIQDGENNPWVWEGKPSIPAIQLNPGFNEMPKMLIMEYAHGRVFGADKYERIRASDVMFGGGFTTTTNVRNFTEEIYWAEGGYFTLPMNLGKITGVKVLPSININARGQGELVWFAEGGTTSMDVSIPRTSWVDAQIQKASLVGRGCAGPWSICTINGEAFYRSHDGWSLFSNSRYEFQSSLSFKKVSAEINRWADKDTPLLRQFASSCFFDNRLLCTVCPEIAKTPNVETHGLHRFHRAIGVVDVEQAASTAPDAGMAFRWNGLWTGINPCQLITAQISKTERCFAFSRDNDGKNRLYEIKRDQGDDYYSGGRKKIKGFFTTRRYDFSASKVTNKFSRKAITGGDAWISGVQNAITAKASYRADSYPCWNQLMAESPFFCDVCSSTNCALPWSREQSKRWKFTSPEESCQAGQSIPSTEGAEFQLKVELIGNVGVDRIRISATTRGNQDAPIGDCPGDDDSCVPIVCCPDKIFSYYSIAE